ncbi:hypothetical protein [Actinocatenispora comari]|uniref:NnrS family protein n=1 Tax=Actinocatenispora comari TaxID=2807577 RepID=A0A8J4AAL5_9ACTN|nr:hypothetical protein [Actinocatenispora comari]GIL27869.1 hypothetical protein NUM_31230 [Actinocatenispora comari]
MPRTVTPAAPTRRRPRWVPPLMAAAVVCLLVGLWAGLLHLGLALPPGRGGIAATHGPLMVLGFLGTFIALERAVALGTTWAYLAPAATAAGGIAVALGAPGGLGPVLLTAGGLGLVAVFVVIHRIQPALHNTVLAAGAACWPIAGALWLGGWDVPRFVPWLVGFLVLTIAGERLELSRLVGATGTARRLFAGAAGVFALGLLVSLPAAPAGVRIAGVGLVAVAGWLGYHDIARRTVRIAGLPRYIAVALLTGYGWLAVAGVLWIVIGRMAGGAGYDAMLHAIFLGFVLSMIFAHAPVIVPAVLGRSLPYRPALYVPLVLLHATLLLRIVGGDLAGSRTAWQWGGSLNEVALLLFLALAASLVVQGRHDRTAPPRSSRAGTVRSG